jgi:hypothetical protein
MRACFGLAWLCVALGVPAQTPSLYVPTMAEDTRNIFWLSAPAVDVCYTLPAGFDVTSAKTLQIHVPMTATNSVGVLAQVALSPSAATACLPFAAARSSAVSFTTAARSFFRIVDNTNANLLESNKFVVTFVALKFLPVLTPVLRGPLFKVLRVEVVFGLKDFNAANDRVRAHAGNGAITDCLLATQGVTVPTGAPRPSSVFVCPFSYQVFNPNNIKQRAPAKVVFYAGTKQTGVAELVSSQSDRDYWALPDPNIW